MQGAARISTHPRRTARMINPMVRHSERRHSLKKRIFGAPKLVLLAFACAVLAILPASAQRERPALDITGYVIDAELDTTAITLRPRPWSASPRPPISTWSPSAFTPPQGHQDQRRRRQAPRWRTHRRWFYPRHASTPFVDGQTSHWTFVYDGTITATKTVPSRASSWPRFRNRSATCSILPAVPMTGYMTDRFTARCTSACPRHEGLCERRHGTPQPITLSNGKPGSEYDFKWTKPGFPAPSSPGVTLTDHRVRQRQGLPHHHHQASGNQLAQTASKEYDFLPTASASRRPPASTSWRCRRCAPAAWAPELASIPGNRVGDKSAVRWLANTIAHQWWDWRSARTPQRRLDHQRHDALRRVDVYRRRERQKCPPRRHGRRSRRLPGL